MLLFIELLAHIAYKELALCKGQHSSARVSKK